MSEKEIKVTDKRMFTADGELREEYKQAQQDHEPEAEAAGAEDTEPAPGPAAAADSAADVGAPKMPDAMGAPGFLDLVSVIAEPLVLYLGDSTLPDGRSLENLDMARFYIDLLELLQKKSDGNLEPEEQQFLDDLLYRIRMRYVQKRG